MAADKWLKYSFIKKSHFLYKIWTKGLNFDLKQRFSHNWGCIIQKNTIYLSLSQNFVQYIGKLLPGVFYLSGNY